ncbi:MAG TPA: hypothetical protein VIZ64_08175 [Dokdonella sp.]
MKSCGWALLGGALAMAGCAKQRVPEDFQLRALLQREDAKAAGSQALDAQAVGCLRAWSGDAELAKGLSVLVAGEDGRKRCHDRLQGWLADSSRNPAQFTFEEVSTPDVARRAKALLDAQAGDVHPPGGRVPDALRKQPVAVVKPRPADPSVNLGAAGAELSEAEILCTQAAQKAQADGAGARSNLQRFANYCGGRLQKLRTKMETAAKAGRKPEELDSYAASARGIATTARELLAAPPE